MTYEYTMLTLDHGYQIEAALNEWGRAGWRVINTLSKRPQTAEWVFLLERERL